MATSRERPVPQIPPLTKASYDRVQEHATELKRGVDTILGEIDTVLGYPAPTLR